MTLTALGCFAVMISLSVFIPLKIQGALSKLGSPVQIPSKKIVVNLAYWICTIVFAVGYCLFTTQESNKFCNFLVAFLALSFAIFLSIMIILWLVMDRQLRKQKVPSKLDFQWINKQYLLICDLIVWIIFVCFACYYFGVDIKDVILGFGVIIFSRFIVIIPDRNISFVSCFIFNLILLGCAFYTSEAYWLPVFLFVTLTLLSGFISSKNVYVPSARNWVLISYFCWIAYLVPT